MRLFQAALDTCLDSPFFASLSVHGLHFTVYAPSIWAMFDRLRPKMFIWVNLAVLAAVRRDSLRLLDEAGRIPSRIYKSMNLEIENSSESAFRVFPHLLWSF